MQFHFHRDKSIQKAILNLCDELTTYERATKINTLIIIRDDRDFQMRAIDGVQAYVPTDVSDIDLLKRFGG